MKLNFFEAETAIKRKLCAMLDQLNQRHKRAKKLIEFVVDCIADSEEQDLSTQFRQMQKNQLLCLQEHFERYCSMLPVVRLNSAKYDMKLMKSYLLPILVQDIELTVIMKANKFVSFNLGDIQLLDLTL